MGSILRRKSFFVICLSIVFVVAVCFYRVSQRPPPAFTAEQLKKIQDMMTEGEVEKILGYPPGDYCTDTEISEIFHTYYIDRPLLDEDHKEWLSDEGMFQIYFKDGTVCLKHFYPSIFPRRGWLERMKSRFGL